MRQTFAISKKNFVPILYRDRDFEAFDDLSDFVESISCEPSESCQVRGSNPCWDRPGPPECQPGGPPKIPLRPRLSAREIREPDFEATDTTARPLSFLVACPTGASPPTPGGVWPRRTAGRQSGLRRTRRASGPKPQPLGNPVVRCGPAVVFPTGPCELDRKTTIPLTRPPRTGDTAGCTQNR